MSQLRYLRCLGQPALYAPTGEPIRFRTRKHLALLVYLAVEGNQPQRRDRLAELFWPRAPLAEARHSLATALSVLRPRLGPGVLEATRDQVSLTDGHLELDLDRLAAGDSLGSETRSPLEVAGFLEGFDIPDAGEFGLWKDRQQARWLPAVMSAFAQGLERCRRAGDTRQIEQIADKMLALDPVCEDAVRAKMEVLTFAGDRLAALRLYEAWRNRIAEDLGAAPSAQLERMAARLRQRGWERAPLGDLPVAPPDQTRSRPFIGRATEYQALYDAWQQLKQGRSAHILLTGDSGVGKTRLVERLTTAASLDGAAISRVQCYELEREIPYATVSGLINGLLDCAEVSGTPPEALAELSRTVPDVRRRFPAIPTPRDSQGDTARIELAEAFHQLLQAVAEERPVILVVDDMHLADDASLSVLHLVARRAAADRVMMILVARAGELTRSRQGELLLRGPTALGMRMVEIRELSSEESTQLLACLMQVQETILPQDVQQVLLSAARGIPLVLEFLLQDWRSNGDASLALAVSAMTSELATAGEGPETYRRILHGIIRTLEPAAQTVLQLAAILGPRLNDLSLYGLADLSLGHTLAGLAQLASLHVLRDSGEGLEFVNELLRAEVYASVPSSLRRALHGSIADRLLAAGGSVPTAAGLEIAWHCVRAGRQKEAIPHLLLGASEAMRKGAAHLAQRALETALPTMEAAEGLEARLLLVEALQEQGRWRDSLDQLRPIQENAQGMPQWRAQALAALAMQHLGTHFVIKLRERIPELTTLLKECSDAKARVKVGRVMAYLATDLRDQGLAAELLHAVKAIPTEGADEDTLDQLALTNGLLLYLAGHSPQSQALVKATIERFNRRGTANLVAAQLIGGLGTICAHEGKYQEAVTHFRDAFEMTSRLGIDTTSVGMAGNLSLSYGRLGIYDQQLYWLTRAPRPWGAEFGGFADVQLAYSRGLAHGMRGYKGEISKAIEEVESRMHGVLPSWLRQSWQLWKADLLLLSGKRSEALFTARESLEQFGSAPLSVSFTGVCDRWMALVSRPGEELSKVQSLVEGHRDRLEFFDALDQLEILCGASILNAKTGRMDSALAGIVQERLRRLPPGVGDLLGRLEFLPMYFRNETVL